MQIAIFFYSRYGSTRKYVEWLGKQCAADIFNLSEFKTVDSIEINRYSTIIYAAPLHMGKLYGANFIKRNWNNLKNKRILVLSTSGTPPKHKLIQIAYRRSLPEELRQKISFFPIQGQYIRSKLNFFDYALTFVARLIGLYYRFFQKDISLYRGIAVDQPDFRPEQLNLLIQALKE